MIDNSRESRDASNEDGLVNRRTFLTRTAIVGAGTMLPIGIASALSKPGPSQMARGQHISHGDAAILRFLAAAEILETDLWQQYNELANANPDYMDALETIDDDMPTYVAQNTEDEFSHFQFLNAFLQSQNQDPVNLDEFRTLPSSNASGAQQTGRLTSLSNLNVDTSWYTRYRASLNPDFGESTPQIVNIINRPAIPLHDGYTSNQIQAIANTAAFHFAMIEQGGSSLYDAMANKVESSVALRIVASIGGTEVAHFNIWNDKAGDTPSVDSGDGLVFPDLESIPQFPNSQVMPKPCKFISANLPLCSIMRPTSPNLAGATAAVHFLKNTGLFFGQSQAFFNTLLRLAAEADAASHGQF